MTSVGARTVGRPRSAQVEAAVRAAVRSELEARGYRGLSVEQVAARAGVAKTTIYRRWPAKADMVFAAVLHGTGIAPPADTGTLDGDVRALTAHVLVLLGARHSRAALPGLITDLASDPELARRFHEGVVLAQRRVVAEVLDRAVGRGELPALPDVDDVHGVLLGAAFAWLHLLGAQPPPGLADRLADAVLAVVRPTPSPEGAP